MAQRTRPQAETLYGLPQPLQTGLFPPIIATRNPTSSDTGYPLGAEWINKSGNSAWTLTSVSAGSASWQASGGGSSLLSSLTGDTGTATPSSGNIKIAGTANQITTAASGSTVTLSLPAAITAPGSLTTTTSLSATTTVTGGTGVTATTGNVTATAGAVNAGTSMTATSGNITATAGNFVSSTAGNGILLNSATTSGTTTATLNGRVGQITITTPSIAAGATFAMTITNSAITGSGTQVGYWLTGGTTGAALTIQSYANTASQSVVTIQNGTGATTNTASLILNFLVLN